MTDTPKVGILCAGKDSAELANSIYGASYITKLLRESGYTSGGYHTALFAKADESERKSATIKLISLCKSNDLVITVGAEGFSQRDMIPEITKSICAKHTDFFSAYLNGSLAAQDPSFLPSRSFCGIADNCLILNIRSDKDFIRKHFPLLIRHINFAILGICAKNAAESLMREKELLKNIDL